MLRHLAAILIDMVTRQRHPAALLVDEILPRVNLQLRAKKIDKLKQMRGWWGWLVQNMYQHPIKVALISNLATLLLGFFGVKIVSYLTAGNKFWLVISFLVWLIIFTATMILYVIMTWLVNYETKAVRNERWNKHNVLYMRERGINRAQAEQGIASAISYYNRHSCYIRRLINFLLFIVGAFLSNPEFRMALLTFPLTLSLTDIWNADKYGTMFLFALLLSFGYYLWRFGIDLARLNYAMAQFELHLD